MLIIGCSKGRHLGKAIAEHLGIEYIELEVKRFPDNEIYLRYPKGVSGEDVVFVQSFYGEINDALVEVIFAAETAEDLGAKRLILAAPYFPYLRQDKRFKEGECISLRTVAGVIDDFFDEIMIIDPHLHREKTLSHIFKIHSKKLTADHLIAAYIKENIKNPLLVGPDEESYRWAKKTAEDIGAESVILEKERHSGREVTVFFNKEINAKDKNIVIVDDIISTGNTLIETIKHLKQAGARKITCIAVHGIFTDNSLARLSETGAKIISTNTIPNETAEMDVSKIIADALKKEK